LTYYWTSPVAGLGHPDGLEVVKKREGPLAAV
jgi:hypothetical protein